MPFQANQSPVISQPSRIVALASPPATSFCPTVTHLESYEPAPAAAMLDEPSDGISGMDHTWCTGTCCHQPMLPIAVMLDHESVPPYATTAVIGALRYAAKVLVNPGPRWLMTPERVWPGRRPGVCTTEAWAA